MTNQFPEIICICETWLKSDFSDCLFPYHDKYQIFRKDRDRTRGGGVVIMVRNDLNCHLIEYECLSNVEALCVRIKCNAIEFYVANFYRHSVAEVSVLKQYEEVFRLLTETKLPVVITGDFNLPGINWEIPDAPTAFKQNQFLDTFLSFGLVQKVTEPTRRNKVLDLVLCNDANFVYDVVVGPPVGLSDHNTVFCKLNVCLLDESKRFVYDWESADCIGLCASIELLSWRYLFRNCTDIDSVWNVFVKQCKILIDSFVPKKEVKSINRRRKIVYPSNIRNLLLKKKRLYKLRHNSPASYVKFRTVVKECKRAIYSFKLQKESAILQNPSGKKFFSYANSKLSSKSRIPDLKVGSDILCGD